MPFISDRHLALPSDAGEQIDTESISALDHEKSGTLLWADGQSLFGKPELADIYRLAIDCHECAIEGIRSYGGVPFQVETHVVRLLSKAQSLGLRTPYSRRDIEEACIEVAGMPCMRDSYFQIAIWGGAPTGSLDILDASAHFAVQGWNLPSSYRLGKDPSPMRLSLAPLGTGDPPAMLRDVKCSRLSDKHTAYRREAQANGFDDALLLDHQGIITQTTRANIFFVGAGAIHTPKAEGFIDRITRQIIIDIARQENLSVYERYIGTGTMGHASEVFLASTALEVVPVAAIGECKFRSGKITGLIRDRYRQMVKAETSGATREAPRDKATQGIRSSLMRSGTSREKSYASQKDL
nr:aminotransferase class IV [uncultured Hyphomonas sp.]